MSEANVNSTDIQVPETMHIESNPITKDDGDEEIAVFKDEVRDSIFAKRREMLEKEVESQKPIDVAEKEEIAEDIAIPKQASDDSNKEETKSEEEKFILNVYGQQKELTKDELIKEAQKGMAATQIFQEGHRLKEEAIRTKEEALQIANAVKQNLQPVKAEQPITPQVVDKDKIKDIAKRINYGSEAEQEQGFLELLDAAEAKVRGQVQQALPPEQLINVATQQAIAAMKAEQEQEILKKEFPDILADYPISMATDMIVNQLADKYKHEGRAISRLDLFREAGTLAREKYLKPVSEPVKEVPPVQAAKIDISNDKIERKRAAPKHPVAANKIATEPPPAYGVGVSSIVNQMRKARGQPVY